MCVRMQMSNLSVLVCVFVRASLRKLQCFLLPMTAWMYVLHICMYVYLYVCIYVCMFLRTYVYTCVYICLCIFNVCNIYISMRVLVFVCFHVCGVVLAENSAATNACIE